MLVNESVAVREPAVVGLNATEKGTVCPAAIVAGSERPVSVKAELLELAALMVTLAPVAVRLPDAVALLPLDADAKLELYRLPDAVPLLPTVTLPRLSRDGETESWPVVFVTLLP